MPIAVGKQLKIKIDSLDLSQILDGLDHVRNHGRTRHCFCVMVFSQTRHLYARNAATQTKRKGLLTIISASSAVLSDRSTLKELEVHNNESSFETAC